MGTLLCIPKGETHKMISAFLLGLCFGAGAYALASVHDYNIKERRLKQMNKKCITVNLDEDVVNTLKRLAHDEKRSVSNFTNTVLISALTKYLLRKEIENIETEKNK